MLVSAGLIGGCGSGAMDGARGSTTIHTKRPA